MLVLTRRPGESIQIAGGITITVLSVGPNRVRLGIEAPREVRVMRGELVTDASKGTEAGSAQDRAKFRLLAA